MRSSSRASSLASFCRSVSISSGRYFRKCLSLGLTFRKRSVSLYSEADTREGDVPFWELALSKTSASIFDRETIMYNLPPESEAFFISNCTGTKFFPSKKAPNKIETSFRYLFSRVVPLYLLLRLFIISMRSKDLRLPSLRPKSSVPHNGHLFWRFFVSKTLKISSCEPDVGFTIFKPLWILKRQKISISKGITKKDRLLATLYESITRDKRISFFYVF